MHPFLTLSTTLCLITPLNLKALGATFTSLRRYSLIDLHKKGSDDHAHQNLMVERASKQDLRSSRHRERETKHKKKKENQPHQAREGVLLLFFIITIGALFLSFSFFIQGLTGACMEIWETGHSWERT
jgi:hypothetical protein